MKKSEKRDDEGLPRIRGSNPIEEMKLCFFHPPIYTLPPFLSLPLQLKSLATRFHQHIIFFLFLIKEKVINMENRLRHGMTSSFSIRIISLG